MQISAWTLLRGREEAGRTCVNMFLFSWTLYKLVSRDCQYRSVSLGGVFGHKMVVLIKWTELNGSTQFVDRSIFINYLIKHLAEKNVKSRKL